LRKYSNKTGGCFQLHNLQTFVYDLLIIELL